MKALGFVYQSHEDAMMVQHLASETTYLHSSNIRNHKVLVTNIKVLFVTLNPFIPVTRFMRLHHKDLAGLVCGNLKNHRLNCRFSRSYSIHKRFSVVEKISFFFFQPFSMPETTLFSISDKNVTKKQSKMMNETVLPIVSA